MDNNLDKNEKMRLTALDRAIQSAARTEYSETGLATVNSDKVLEAAKKFEAYLKGEANAN